MILFRSSSVGNLNAVSVNQSRSTVKPFKQSRDVSTVDLTRKEERDSGYGKSEKCRCVLHNYILAVHKN